MKKLAASIVAISLAKIGIKKENCNVLWKNVWKNKTIVYFLLSYLHGFGNKYVTLPPAI